MKKSIRFLAVTLVCTIFAACTMAASACTKQEAAEVIEKNADAQIECVVSSAQVTGNLLLAVGLTPSSPAVQALCNSVETRTGVIMDNAESSLQKLGVTCPSENETVVIAGNSVVIDPFIII